MQKEKANAYNVNMAYCSLTKAMGCLLGQDHICPWYYGYLVLAVMTVVIMGKQQFAIYTSDIMVVMQSAEDSLILSTVITVKLTTKSEIHVVNCHLTQ